MEPGGSMPHSQGLSNNANPKPNQRNSSQQCGNLREKFWLVGSVTERRVGDPGSNPGPGENFSLKLTKKRVLYVIIQYKV